MQPTFIEWNENKGSAKFRLSEEKENIFAFLSVRTYKNIKKENVSLTEKEVNLSNWVEIHFEPLDKGRL